MIVKEYRIPLPLDVDEFKRGQLYAVAECSKNETGGGEGVEFLKHEGFLNNTVCPGHTLSGMYTHNIYRLRSKAPWLLQKINGQRVFIVFIEEMELVNRENDNQTLPEEAFEVHEESWNAYPYCKTIISNPGFMKNDFYIIIESMHVADNGRSENVLNAPKKREVVVLDICDDRLIGKNDYCAETDPKLFKSQKTSRGQLQTDWVNSAAPIMCCYKLVTIHFKWTGLGAMVERTIQKEYPKVFGKFHRETFCWLDNWIDLSMEDIRRIEMDTAVILKRQLKDPEKRGTKCDTEKD